MIARVERKVMENDRKSFALQSRSIRKCFSQHDMLYTTKVNIGAVKYEPSLIVKDNTVLYRKIWFGKNNYWFVQSIYISSMEDSYTDCLTTEASFVFEEQL